MAEKREVFLYYCQWTQQDAINTNEAYCAGFSDRLIPTLNDIEKDADRATQLHWEAAMRESYSEESRWDESDIAEAARDAGIEVYQNLSFVRQQLIGLAIAGIYHLWERTIIQFLTKELKHYHGTDKHINKLERGELSYIKELLTMFGYDMSAQPYYVKLNELRLVANTVKHGSGKSCDELFTVAPDLFDSLVLDFIGKPSSQHLKLPRWTSPALLDDFQIPICNFSNSIGLI